MDVHWWTLPDGCEPYSQQILHQILSDAAPLGEADKALLEERLLALEEEIRKLEDMKLSLGLLKDLLSLKEKGFSRDALSRFHQEDLALLEEADLWYQNNLARRDYMFGYPANMEEDSYLVRHLRGIESRLYLMNNCGDPYQRGNYGMDSKAAEQKTISLIADNLGIPQGEYWGYITSGGTEGNYWAIREGMKRYPRATLYFSTDAHYSIPKYVTDMEREYIKIPTLKDGSISPAILLETIFEDKSAKRDGVILILTWGTTCSGAIDHVKEITDAMHAHGIPYFCHLDAAHYGGIPAGQKDSPTIQHAPALGIDTVAVSLHKYIGVSRVNGVVLALSSRINRGVVPYIGQEDTTLLGSRDYAPFSTYQKIKEKMSRTEGSEYITNIRYFENLLIEAHIPYCRCVPGNTFVIPKPSDDTCNRFQLADFPDETGASKAHIIIFPFHQKQIMEELVSYLKRDLSTPL